MPQTTLREALAAIHTLPVPEERDVRGRPVRVGDLVSVPTYPRGTMRGTVVLSDRALQEQPDGTYARTFCVRDDSGTLWGWSRKARLIEVR